MDVVEGYTRGKQYFEHAVKIMRNELVYCAEFTFLARLTCTIGTETQVSGGGHGYSRPEDVNNRFVNQASWERQPASAQATRRTSEVRYGSI